MVEPTSNFLIACLRYDGTVTLAEGIETEPSNSEVTA
jgi:hypothetical protein